MIITGVAFAQNTFPPSGNTGIGTTSPSELLHVKDNTSSTIGMHLENVSGPTEIRFNSSNANWFIKSTLNNDLYFDKDNTFSRINRVVFRGSGEVGIGTTNPANILHIKSGSTASDGLKIENSSTTGSASILFNTNAGANNAAIHSDSGGNLLFNTGSTNKVYINNSDGHVGIGTGVNSSIDQLQLYSTSAQSDGILISRGNYSGNLNLRFRNAGNWSWTMTLVLKIKVQSQGYILEDLLIKMWDLEPITHNAQFT
jgi:hypothetical protein